MHMKNILVITYWSFPDALIQTYTLPYVRIIKKNLPTGSTVFLLTLEKDRDLQKSSEQIELKEGLISDGIQLIPFVYRPFGLIAFFHWMLIMFRLIWLIHKSKIQVVHCWATPAGAIGYLLSVVTGRKLVLDSYEPHAEAMVENGTWKKDSFAFKILFWLEKKQSQRDTTVIAATKGMQYYAQEKYGTKLNDFWVKPACVDFNLFSGQKKKNPDLLAALNLTDKIVCVYAGKFGGIYLDREVFDFFKIAHNYWGDRFRVMLLTSHKQNEIEHYCTQAGLDPGIIRVRFVSHADVPGYMGLADFAITPVRPVPTKRYCTPIKDGEYWALGLPVVIPAHVSDDSDIIEMNHAGAVLYALKENDYRAAIEKIEALLKINPDEMFSRIHGLAQRYRSFQIAERVYENVYGNGFK